MSTPWGTATDPAVASPPRLPPQLLGPRADESAPEAGESIDAQEHGTNLARTRRVLPIGMVLWIGFGLADWSAARFVQPLSLGYLWALRGLEILVLLAVLFRLHRGRPVGPRELRLLDLLVYSTASVLVGLMCVEYGGLTSSYLGGQAAVLIAQGVMQPEPYRRGAGRLGLSALLAPATILLSALWKPAIAAQLTQPASLVVFTANATVLCAAAALLVAAGHAHWSLRRRLFSAKRIGKYKLRRRIGEGGMGEVWQAYHPALRRDVAIKILRADAGAAAMMARFEREIVAMTELCHPNTVRVFDCGVTDDGFCYYAMELLAGETLGELVARVGPLTEARAVHIVGQAARALVEAHGRGIVHRDIKPDNLFIATVPGEPDFTKLLDFGIAKLSSGDDLGLTRAGALVGTPLFMSPEQAQGRPVDPRSDLYGLGGVLYFALTGHPPFEGPATRVLVSHVTSTPRPLLEAGARVVSPELEELVSRCLAKRPEDRFDSAADLVDALAALRLPPPRVTTLANPLAVTQPAEPPPRPLAMPTPLAPTVRSPALA